MINYPGSQRRISSWLKHGEQPSVRDFGGRPDGREGSDGEIGAASTTLTSAAGTFADDDAGKVVVVFGAGAAGERLKTTIATVTDSTHVELADAAATAVTGAHYMYGSDAAIAIRAGLACGRRLFLPKPNTAEGTLDRDFYLLASYSETVWYDNAVMFEVGSHQELYGEPGTVLKLADGTLYDTPAPQGGIIFFADQKDRVYLHDFEIDMNGLHNLTPAAGLYLNWAVYFEGGNWNTADWLVVRDTPGRNCIATEGIPFRPHPATHFKVRHCRCINGGTSIAGNTEQSDFSAMYSTATYTVFEDNVIEHDAMPRTNCGGIEVHGSYSRVSGNRLDYCYPAIYLETDIADTPLLDVQITENVFTRCLVGISLFPFSVPGASFGKITIARNTAHLLAWSIIAGQNPWFISQPRDDPGYFTSDGQPYDPPNNFLINDLWYDSLVTENIVTDDTPLPSATLSSFARVSGTRNLTFGGNLIGTLTGPAYQIIGSPFGHENLTIDGEAISDFGLNSGAYNHMAILVDLKGHSIDPPKAAYDLDGLHIRNLTLARVVPDANATGFYLDWDAASSVQNVNLGRCWKRNVDGPLLDGAKAGEVDYVQADGALVAYHAASNTHRQASGITWDGVAKILRMPEKSILDQNGLGALANGGLVQGTGNPDPGAKAGYGEWVCHNCYWDGSDWRQPCGSLSSHAFSSNFNFSFCFRYAPAGGVDDGVVTLTEIARMENEGRLWLAHDVFGAGFLLQNRDAGTPTTCDIKTTGGQGATPPFRIFNTDGSLVLAGVWPDGSVSVGGQLTRVYAGNGSPEGVITAVAGSVYLNTAGGAGTTVWAKESGNGNIGWVAVNTGLSSAPFSDAGALVKNAADGTKQVRFSAAGVASGTTRVLTVPDRDITIGEQSAYLSGNCAGGLLLTTSYQDIPGMTVTLTKPGRWLVSVSAVIAVDPADTYQNVQLLADGVAQTGIIQTTAGGHSQQLGSSRVWIYNSAAGNEVVKAQGKKISGTGASQVNTVDSTLVAIWVAP